jgi:ABC-type branched-subunit amino acid transport system ATPase component
MPILEVEGIEKAFGGLKALNGCTFSVEAGELVGLIGPNGSGKTTAINVICGFHRADGGRVRFQGEEITARPPHRIARAGLTRTFQRAHGWGNLTALDNLLAARDIEGRESVLRGFFGVRGEKRRERADRERAREVLAMFGLTRRTNTPARSLSGGEARLLDFARIVMARPSMVLLDEPLAGVNPVMADHVGEAIQQLLGAGITVLVVEHDLVFVERNCNRVIAMELGAVIGEGTLASLRGRKEFVDAYLGVA